MKQPSGMLFWTLAAFFLATAFAQVQLYRDPQKEADAYPSLQLNAQHKNEEIVSDQDIFDINSNTDLREVVKQIIARLQQTPTTNHYNLLKKRIERLEQEKCQTWKKKVRTLKVDKLELGAYHFSDRYTSWANAQDFCESRGMSLATFESNEEMQAVKANRTFEAHFWVGASDIGDTAGQFHWTNGRPVDRTLYNNVTMYEPGNQTCLSLDIDHLSGDPCTKGYRSICEVAPEYLYCV